MKETVTTSETGTGILSSVSRCLSGDSEGFNAVVSQYQGSIYRICCQIIQNPEEAKDAVSEVFLKAYSNLAHFDQTRRFSAWLYRIAVNHCISVVRRKRKEARFFKDQSDNPPASAESPSGSFFHAERSRSVSGLLSRVPVKFRSVLILKYYQDLTYDEIGEIMNIPRNTVASYLLRGKKKLRKLMENKGVSHEML